MRVYFAADVEALRALAAGDAVSLAGFVPSSDDEQDEFDAMSQAAEAGRVVVAADVDTAGSVVSLDRVASFHLDVDGTGDLAWYAPQELDQVLDLLRD